MKPATIVPARIAFAADGPPSAPDFGDVYHPAAGALAQARHVFLAGNGLPQRWSARARFVVLETGFGLGNNFLATWDAWRQDARRCERLVYVAIEAHPPRCEDLARAHAGSPLPALAAELIGAWPPPASGLHLRDFEGGRVRLLLALGDVEQLLPALRLHADAVFLDGFAPARNPAMWSPRVLKAVGRRAAPGATAATWSVAAAVRAGLVTAGFEVQRVPGIGGKREITRARFAPRFRAEPPPAPPRDAIVVGAGLAGAAVARALLREGVVVSVLERNAAPAAEASGNPGGLFHGTVHPDDGPYARLFRAAALHAAQVYRDAVAAGVPGAVDGLLRLDARAGGVDAMRALLAAGGLPAACVDALDTTDASRRAGVALAAPAWWYPDGGWLSPADWVRQVLAAPGLRFVGGRGVASLARAGARWRAVDAAGGVIAEADAVVLANAGQANALLAGIGAAPWPLRHTRGQVTSWPGATPLRLPVAGDGYALPLQGALLCGATREPGEPDGDAAPREADHRHNLERLQRLTGLAPPDPQTPLQGRVGWRCHSGDRLPVAGALPASRLPAGRHLQQARHLPREPGLFVLTALGARGLTLAPLLGELVAAMATGAPWPLEQDLADAVDPARWIVRAARGAAGAGARITAPAPA
ncbi:MAG: FAD-dependent 5-carboxymethylaminomethyl-2-thiouridine(34) oxidoreductase MnmC [Rubrivivax sp.]|nr:FAD-dependent 5-carboxymethylaminomethyl-2-thiouridine(34) oxidoreductase MnmC [Rubrivivax sp.]